MDAAGWVLVLTASIGAIGSIVLQALHMWLSYKRDEAAKAAANVVVDRVNRVAADVISVAKETSEQTQAIAQVKKQTDGLTKELVKKSEQIAFDAGKDVGTAEGIRQGNGK